MPTGVYNAYKSSAAHVMRVVAEHTAVVLTAALICIGAWMSGMDWKNFGFAVFTGYLQVLVRTWRLNGILYRILNAEESLAKQKDKWTRKTNKKKRCIKPYNRELRVKCD